MTIAVIEDSNIIGHLIENQLESYADAIELHTCGEKFIESMRPDKPYTIILDYNLSAPGQSNANGVEIYKRIKSINTLAKFIFISGTSNAEIQENIIATGVHYLNKDSDDFFEELEDTVKQLLA